MAEQSASLGRDWNDELQGELSLPSATRQEKYTRWQVVHSTRTAFMHAAVEGAMKVFNGEVPALNPLVVPQHRVYVHNYIFFSQVCSSDTREDDLEQDPASLLPEEAHCRLNHDLLISRELQNMDTLGAQDLHSVMTVVVDYLGQRLVAQSIIPGILQSTEVGRVMCVAYQLQRLVCGCGGGGVHAGLVTCGSKPQVPSCCSDDSTPFSHTMHSLPCYISPRL